MPRNSSKLLENWNDWISAIPKPELKRILGKIPLLFTTISIDPFGVTNRRERSKSHRTSLLGDPSSSFFSARWAPTSYKWKYNPDNPNKWSQKYSKMSNWGSNPLLGAHFEFFLRGEVGFLPPSGWRVVPEIHTSVEDNSPLKNRPSQNEISSSNHWFSGANCLFSGRVTTTWKLATLILVISI